MPSFDLNVLQWCNGLVGHRHGFDVVVSLFTTYAPVLFVVLFAFYFLRRGSQIRLMRRTVLLSGLSGVVALGVTALVTLFFYRARPFLMLPPDQLHLLMPHAPDSSFPSDHTMGSAGFAVGMWRAPDKSARWLFTVVALLVGLSRLVAGVHWPSDVLGSLVLGGAVASGVFALARPLTPLLDWALRLFERIEKRFRGDAPARKEDGPTT